VVAVNDLDVILELDERRRASLGRIGRPEHRRYLVSEEPDGTIILRPAVVMTELEARLLANRALVERIRENEKDPSRLVRHKRPRK
jgi:hypothetical protein